MKKVFKERDWKTRTHNNQAWFVSQISHIISGIEIQIRKRTTMEYIMVNQTIVLK